MYRALVEHDPAFEGLFFVAVTTTRIFCRPTCRARTPRRDHVEFFRTPQEALLGGYRPCLRCRPLDHGQAPPPLVTELLAAVEAEPGSRLRDADLVTKGIDPSTARRQFKRYCGMSFQAYHRARRVGLALNGIRQGKKMLDLQLDQGYESGSGFREAFARLIGTAPSRARDARCLYAQWFETPLGSMLALADDDGLALLEFVDRRGLERELERIQRRLQRPLLPGTHRYLALIGVELAAYFSGRSLTFATPLSPRGSAFQRDVWNALIAIAPGTTRSYGEIAAAIGRPTAVRAVGRANGDNGLAIVIPCHRVIGADGTLTGYGGGLWRKSWLLEHERKFTGAVQPQAELSLLTA
jgi:AraC family transcriptional regulator of adaptative response/methylated-DNA-[protein]-cysteine methyltransferase